MGTIQEFAQSETAVPEHCILREEARPNGAIPVASDIPVIDLSRLSGPNGWDVDEAQKLGSAAQTWGVFQVIGHGLSPSSLDEVRRVSKDFFQLSLEEKQKYSNKHDDLEPEGYKCFGVARKDQAVDWHDRLNLVLLPENMRKLNLWPENPASFREMLHEYTKQTSKLAECILLALARILKLDENYFSNQLGDATHMHVRFNHYPQCSRPDLVMGFNPHTDGTVITLLLPDKEVEGLQVLKDGNWFRVPINPHALVINVGNTLQIMSNGIFKSPVHRVAANTVERISVAMLYLLDPEKTLEPAEGLVDEKRPRLYKSMKGHDFANAFFEQYTKGVYTLEWAQV